MTVNDDYVDDVGGDRDDDDNDSKSKSNNANANRRIAYNTTPAADRLFAMSRPPAANRFWLNPPVVRGSTLAHATLDEFEKSRDEYAQKNALLYGRMGTPTVFAFEDKVAALENAHAGLATSSGLNAIAIALLAFVRHGDHVLIADSVYAPTRKFCDAVLTRFGVAVEYYDPMIGARIDSLLRDNTRCIFMESPGSLTFEVQDARAIAQIAQARNITTIIDNTWSGSHFYRPLDYGVNVSVISATKYFVGHSDAMLGVIAADAAHYDAVRACRTAFGNCASPDDAYLGLRGLKTLRVRLAHHQQAALQLANHLAQQDGVLRVLHPALASCRGHDSWRRDFDGAGGLFSFELQPRGRAAKAALLDGMKLFRIGLSWGGCDSLIAPATPQSSRSATRWDSPGCLIRVFVGLESIDALTADLQDGLRRYFATDG